MPKQTFDLNDIEVFKAQMDALERRIQKLRQYMWRVLGDPEDVLGLGGYSVGSSGYGSSA